MGGKALPEIPVSLPGPVQGDAPKGPVPKGMLPKSMLPKSMFCRDISCQEICPCRGRSGHGGECRLPAVHLLPAGRGDEGMKTGIVFDMKEFAVHDGPGMRQTIFLKGCPLRCSWCHNPEGLCAAPQLMVSPAACTHCGRCRQVCAHEACIACGACVSVCPVQIRRIAGTRMTSRELAEYVHRDSGYYARYGGGVTFSGGEPLMQGEFLLEVLEQLPDLHRALETSGYCSPELFGRVLAKLEYVMMDIKLCDPQKHIRYTGVDNEIILRNARTLCRGETPFVIRIPVIPGVNDNEENYTATARLLEGAQALLRVEFLPYHKTAGAKYAMLGQEYRPDFDPQRGIWISQKIFEEYGIRSVVL